PIAMTHIFPNVHHLFQLDLTEKQQKELEPRISSENHEGLLLTSRGTVLILSILFVISLFGGDLFPYRSMYLIFDLALAFVWFLASRTRPEDGRRNLLLSYLFMTTVLLFTVILGTMLRQKELAAAFDTVLMAAPMFFIDRPRRMTAFLGSFITFFCVMSFIFDADVVRLHDIGNALLFGTVSILVNAYINRTKVQKLAYEEALALRSDWDVLTGLRNRNSFEKRLPEYMTRCKNHITCIYADVNGLHELNNSRGHQAGDLMLQQVGSALQEAFGKEDTYRIGGDEVVAFVPDATFSEIEVRMQFARMRIREHGYHVSIGAATSTREGLDMQKLVQAAEKEMYEKKRAYYEEPLHERREYRKQREYGEG
ncbi:MAG: GGDEF domain-containing protein, partial [Lachnospiraceae bacterium]